MDRSAYQTWERLYNKENKPSTHRRAVQGHQVQPKTQDKDKVRRSRSSTCVGEGGLPGGASSSHALACCACVHWLRGTLLNVHTMYCFLYMVFLKREKTLFCTCVLKHGQQPQCSVLAGCCFPACVSPGRIEFSITQHLIWFKTTLNNSLLL